MKLFNQLFNGELQRMVEEHTGELPVGGLLVLVKLCFPKK